MPSSDPRDTSSVIPFVATRPEFTTNREELFRRLVLNVPTGYVTTQNEHGAGRRYHITVGDFLDAFWRFCDEKEAATGEPYRRDPEWAERMIERWAPEAAREVSLCSKHGPWIENEQGCPGCVREALGLPAEESS